MEVSALVVTDAQPAKLIQPGERALDDPAPLPEAAAIRRSTHGHQWEMRRAPNPVRMVSAS